MLILKYLLSSPQQPSVPTAGWYIILTFFKKPLKTAPGSTCFLYNQITYNLMNFFSEKRSPPTGFTAIWCQMPLKWNDVLWTPTWVLFAACLCLKSVVISHLQPLPSGILHPTGANSAELLCLCSIFPGTGLQTASSWSVPLPSTALLPYGTRCRAPLGSASIWELFDCGVSWQPRAMNLSRAPGQAEPCSSLLVSFCFPGFLWFQAQSRAATGCTWAVFELGFNKQGKELQPSQWSCVVLPRPAPVPFVLGVGLAPCMWHTDPRKEEVSLHEAVLAVEPAVKPVAKSLLGELWDVGMAAGQCITCPEQGRVPCQGVRNHPRGSCCKRGALPSLQFFSPLPQMLSCISGCCGCHVPHSAVAQHREIAPEPGKKIKNSEQRKVKLFILACSCKE